MLEESLRKQVDFGRMFKEFGVEERLLETLLDKSERKWLRWFAHVERMVEKRL